MSTPKNKVNTLSSFLPSSVKIILTGIGLVFITSSIVGLYLTSDLGRWLWAILIIINLILLIFAYQKGKKVFITLENIYSTLLEANQGVFHHRITHTPRLGDMGKVAWEVNDLLDKVEEIGRAHV